MKVTLDIPEALYRKVKAKSALLGKPVREITIALYQRWLEEEEAPHPEASLEALRAWWEEADRRLAQAPPGPTLGEILRGDRKGRG